MYNVPFRNEQNLCFVVTSFSKKSQCSVRIVQKSRTKFSIDVFREQCFPGVEINLTVTIYGNIQSNK